MSYRLMAFLMDLEKTRKQRSRSIAASPTRAVWLADVSWIEADVYVRVKFSAVYIKVYADSTILKGNGRKRCDEGVGLIHAEHAYDLKRKEGATRHAFRATTNIQFGTQEVESVGLAPFSFCMQRESETITKRVRRVENDDNEDAENEAQKPQKSSRDVYAAVKAASANTDYEESVRLISEALQDKSLPKVSRVQLLLSRSSVYSKMEGSSILAVKDAKQAVILAPSHALVSVGCSKDDT
jgi:hypothetical protein